MKATSMKKRTSVIMDFYDAKPKQVLEVMLAMTEIAAKRNLDFEWVLAPRKKLKTAKKPKPTSRKHVLVSRRKLKAAVK